jgi:predicted esterase
VADRTPADGTLAIGPELKDAAAVAILAHGRGSAPSEIRRLAQAIGIPAIRFIMPAAPGGAWYPQGFMAPIAHNEPALSRSLASLADLVDDLIGGGIAANRIVLGGFSQGACLAAEFMVRHPRRYAAAFILTGGLIGPTGTIWPEPKALTGVPVYLSGSEIDAWVPAARVRETEKHLRASGAIVTSRIFERREHLVSDEEIVAVRDLLNGVIAA